MITNVKILQDYCLELTFDDGISGTVDLSVLVGKGVFAFWRDPQAFEQVRIGSSGELVWNEQVDLCPDSLYLKVTGKKPEDIFPELRQEQADEFDREVATLGTSEKFMSFLESRSKETGGIPLSKIREKRGL
jgi:hypothetical protein